MSNISFYKIGYIAIMKSTGNGEIEAKAKQTKTSERRERKKSRHKKLLAEKDKSMQIKLRHTMSSLSKRDDFGSMLATHDK